MTFDFWPYLLGAGLFLMVAALVFTVVCVFGGFFPDDLYIVVVDGVQYYDVRNIKVSGDSVSFDTGEGMYSGVKYDLPYTEVEVIEMHKGFFQKEYVEVQQ